MRNVNAFKGESRDKIKLKNKFHVEGVKCCSKIGRVE